MKKKIAPILLRIGILIVMGLSAAGAFAHDDLEDVDLTSRPGHKDAPIEVVVLVRVIDIEEISGATQSFTANLVVQAAWKDERLAGKNSEYMAKLSEIWHPMVQLINQQRLATTLPDVARVSPDGSVMWAQRYWGKFSNPLDMRDFPLDRHTFFIQLVGAAQLSENVRFIVKEEGKFKSGLAEKLSLPDWAIKEWRMTSSPITLVDGGDTMAGARFEFDAGRYLGYYLIKVLMPLLMIVMMSWIVFWIHPTDTGPQISVSVTSMLTLIAYRFALGNSLPRVSYLTRMDAFIMFSTILVFVALLESVLTSHLVKTGREEQALKMDRRCRIIFPVMFLLVFLLSVIVR